MKEEVSFASFVSPLVHFWFFETGSILWFDLVPVLLALSTSNRTPSTDASIGLSEIHLQSRSSERFSSSREKFVRLVEEVPCFALRMDLELEVIFQSLSFNDKLDENELEMFFERCDLSASKGEIEEATRIVLQRRILPLLSSPSPSILFV